MNGPVFLTLSEEKWPKGNSKLESSSQQKQETSAYSASQAQTSKEEFISLTKYPSLTRLLRVTAYSFRFVYNCRCRRTDRQSGPLLVEELERAQKFWIGTAKVKSFPQEIATLKRNQQVSPKSRLPLFLPSSMETKLFVLVDGSKGQIFHSQVDTPLCYHLISPHRYGLS